MNRILCYGDIHHGTSIGKLGKTGVDLRIEDSLKVENIITELCQKNDIDTIFFCGDRFKSRSPSIWLSNLVDEIWADRAKAGITTYAVLGNHDSYRIVSHGNNYSGLWAKIDNMFIMDKPHVTNIKGRKVGFLPNGYSLSDMPEKVDLLIFHDELYGIQDDRGYTPIRGLEPDRLKDVADYGITGHIHSHQEFFGGLYLGAPYQIDMLDVGKPRGCIVLDMEDFDYDFVDLSTLAGVPELVRLDIKKSDKDKLDEILSGEKIYNNYIYCTVDKSLVKKVRKTLEENEARWFQILERGEKGIFIEKIAKKIYQEDNIEDMIKEYVSSRDLVDKKNLVETGIEIWGDR